MTALSSLNRDARVADLARIIHGKPAAPLATLPAAWQMLAQGPNGTGLSDQARLDYVEAAQLFAHHGTPLAREALSTLARDFAVDRYPDFIALRTAALHALAVKAVDAIEELFATLGRDVPAAFYDVLVATAFRNRPDLLLAMFKDEGTLMRDRLWDAALHGALLVTPVALFVHSVFSRHGLRFTHMMDCGCSMTLTDEAPFTIALDPVLKPAILQNMLAAAFEQYGTNADTSGAARGF